MAFAACCAANERRIGRRNWARGTGRRWRMGDHDQPQAEYEAETAAASPRKSS